MILNEKTGLYENYGLWHVPFWQTQKFQLMLEISGLVAALIIIIILIRKYRAYRARKKLSPWDQALLDLRALKSDNKVAVEHGKEFYLAISALLKKYFHERFCYDVLGKTDAEVVHYLQEHHVDEQIVAEINALLQGSVIIKFANAQAAQGQIEHDYVRAVAIIQRTIPEKK
jgi:hypothetical protein